MTDLQLEAMEQLLALGFDLKTARTLIITCEFSTPLRPEIRLNAELLSKYVDIKEFSEKRRTQIIVFLKRDYCTNLFLESVPDRYAFSEEQRRLYFEHILDWDVDYDLRNAIDDQLRLIMPDEDDRMDVYREMYCNGAWHDSDTISDICRTLQEIASGHDNLYQFAKQQWYMLFSYYSGTMQYIEKLKKLFRTEYIWMIFCETSANVREFTVRFNPFDRKQMILEQLMNKYPSYLYIESDEQA